MQEWRNHWNSIYLTAASWSKNYFLPDIQRSRTIKLFSST